MTNPQHIDPERLAALLDGRLSDVEAAALRAQLANSDDDVLSAYADSVAISGELMPRSVRWILPSFAAIAAVLIAAVLLRTSGERTPSPSPDTGIAAYAVSVPLSASLPGSPVWGATRGTQQVATDEGRAIRVGALLTDLEVALRRRDTASAPIAESIASHLSDVAGAAGVANALRNGARAASASRDEDLHRSAIEGSRVVDEELARAGAWIEGARLASSAGDWTFFDQFPVDISMRPLQTRSDLSPAQRNALDRVVVTSRANQRSAAEMSSALVTLLREMSR